MMYNTLYTFMYNMKCLLSLYFFLYNDKYTFMYNKDIYCYYTSPYITINIYLLLYISQIMRIILSCIKKYFCHYILSYIMAIFICHYTSYRIFYYTLSCITETFIVIICLLI